MNNVNNIFCFFKYVYEIYMNKLILFDVDGTLTPPRKVIESPMFTCLQNLKKVPNITVGFVGGSDLNKQKEQLGEGNFFFI